MSDERVQQVIDELNPTSASEAAWPVSRRQTLRALAAAGLLGAGSSSATGESAGTVIADEASFSNYASEDVSDGWELTIDDDVFGLTESDEETIELPDGGVGEEVIMPDGVSASEMIAPDGSVVFEGDAILDEQDLHARYDFSEYSGTDNFADLSGNNNDLINGSISGITENINGIDAGEFDGDGDSLWTDSFTDILPATISVVMKVTGSALDNHGIIATFDSDFAHIEWQGDPDDNWRISRGDALNGGDNIDIRLLTAVVTASGDSILREDGDQTASGDSGSREWNINIVGAAGAGVEERPFEGAIGEMLIYDSDKRNSLSDIEAYLIDKWDLSI